MTAPFARNDAELSRRASYITNNGARPLAQFGAPPTLPGQPPTSPPSYYDLLDKYKGQHPAAAPSGGLDLGGLGSGIIDLLSRGVYTGAGFSKELVKNIQGDADAGNPFSAALKGLTGETKQTYSDVISEIDPDAPDWVKFVGGLAGDIVLDPANLVLGGAGIAVRSGVKALQAGKVAAKATEDAANAAKTLTVAQKRALPEVNLGERSKTVVPLLSVSRQAGLQANSRIAAAMNPVRRLFSPGFGFEVMNDAFRSGSNMAESLVAGFRKDMSKINKTHGADKVQEGYSAYGRGVPPVDPEAKAAMDHMLPYIARYSDPNDPFLKRMLTSHAGIRTLNKSFKDKGSAFRFDPTKGMTAGANGVQALDHTKLLQQLKEFEPKDPLGHMDQMHQAVMQTKVTQDFADAIVKQSGKTTARPGMGKLKNSSLQGTALGEHLRLAMGGKQYYFPTDILDQMTRMNHMLSAPTSFKDSSSLLGKTIRNVVVPAMNIWKPYMTIARPAHHVRNLYSDVMITAMDGIGTRHPGIYSRAKKVLATGGAIKKTGAQGLNELEEGIGKGTDKLSTVRLRGSNVDMSADGMYKSAYKEGLLPSHQLSEDFIAPTANASTGKGNITKALLENPYMLKAGQVAEWTNHYTRMAHYIGIMEDKKFTRQFDSLEEAAHAAAIRVKKHHPDPSGLTPFEQKNMRLAFPFYSWTRQTLPAVMNAAISKPGRVTGLSKTAYEFAKMTGMNPESIGDPFPVDGVYPSFVKENLLGPLLNVGGAQIGLTTGSPQESIFGDLLNVNPLDYAAGNMNPLAKGAVEALVGTNLDTQKPIINRADRTDQQLPVLNQVPKLTGVSPTALIQYVLSRGQSGSVLSANAKRGTNNIPLNIINLLTGAGASDFQSSTFRNIAKQELADQ